VSPIIRGVHAAGWMICAGPPVDASACWFVRCRGSARACSRRDGVPERAGSGKENWAALLHCPEFIRCASRARRSRCPLWGRDRPLQAPGAGCATGPVLQASSATHGSPAEVGADLRPVGIAFGDVAGDVLRPPRLHVFEVVQVQLVLDDFPGLGIDFRGVALRDGPRAVTAVLRRVLLRAGGEQVAVLGAGEVPGGLPPIVRELGSALDRAMAPAARARRAKSWPPAAPASSSGRQCAWYARATPSDQPGRISRAER
jgi:hypothetical protein